MGIVVTQEEVDCIARIRKRYEFALQSERDLVNNEDWVGELDALKKAELLMTDAMKRYQRVDEDRACESKLDVLEEAVNSIFKFCYYVLDKYDPCYRGPERDKVDALFDGLQEAEEALLAQNKEAERIKRCKAVWDKSGLKESCSKN